VIILVGLTLVSYTVLLTYTVLTNIYSLWCSERVGNEQDETVTQCDTQRQHQLSEVFCVLLMVQDRHMFRPITDR